jgi:D-serine deaminase-like pyridoxal phosphate-dependent protein
MITDLPTPFILLDAPTVRRNLARMAQYAAEHGLKLRPHTKTHKSPFLGKLQMELGATGLTVAKPGEALVMSAVADDLFMAYPPLNAERCDELAKLAREKTVRVGIDSAFAADQIGAAARRNSTTVGVLVDLDVGLHRTGVQSPQEALALAQHISRAPGLRLDGLMIYPGHVPGTGPTVEPALAAVDALVAETLGLFRRDGLAASIVSGGSTPTAYHSHKITGQTEIRPGTYIFNDMNCVHGGYVALEDCAARIVTTVVSTAVPGQFVLDAGSKTLTSDRCGPAPDSGHGCLLEYPDAKVVKLSEEHAQVDASKCAARPKVGERVTVIPNHICPCVNLQDRVWWHDAGEVTPLPVEARGKVY